MKTKLSKLYKLSPEFLNPQLTDFKLIKKIPSVSLHRDDLATLLKKTEWSIDYPIKIEKNFKFRNFVESFSFLSNLAHFSEVLDHHAFIQNVYDKVKIELNTHDCKGISIKDVLLANILVFLMLIFEFLSLIIIRLFFET